MKLRSNRLTHIGAGLLVSLIVFLLAGSSQLLVVNAGQSEEKMINNLPVVGSVQNLQKLLLESQNFGRLGGGINIDAAATENQAQASAKKEVAYDYSGTNTQVEGVDEADLVKTDGEYIYKVNADRLLIIKAYPADKMQVVSTISFAQNFKPVEIFLYKDKLVLIGSTTVPLYKPYARENLSSKVKLLYPIYKFSTTTAVVYDINDKDNPRQIRELELEGRYLSARRVDETLYLVTSRSIDYYAVQNGNGDFPAYRDSVQGSDFIELPLNTVRYFPGCITSDYLSLAALDLSKDDARAQVESYLGGGENIYASEQNLYVAGTINRLNHLESRQGNYYTNETQIYRFTLGKGKFNYSGSGSVPGKILNQFSMDEHDRYFRIATTTGSLWGEGAQVSKNNLYVLDKELKIVGSLEGIAPGEKIYSTRFLGDRAFMVTFREVDPFFVLDLHDPQNPSVLGKLKIPGYSDYLHPYDENHIIGFGKDTAEVKSGDDSQAFYQGLKVALFDVTDVSNPVEMCKVIIGDRGTDSELLNNHKALLFSKSKNLLAFPVTVMEKQPLAEGDTGSVTEYGTFTFQGAYIYQIDLQYGLQLRGKITHLSPKDYELAGDYWYDSDKNVQRILYLGDTLYTISEAMLKAHHLGTLKEIGSLELTPTK